MPGEIIPYSADYERKLLTSTEPAQKSMIPKIIKSGYNALDLIYFFTSGKD
jgi:ribosome-binding ATPase YchF (GTP1/OBG family)